MLNVRSKVASKISKIKEADDFNFANWLKKPLHQEYPVEQLSSYLANVEDIHLEIDSPEFSKFKFDMPEPEVTDELKNCEFKKIKSNAIFFMIALPLEKGIAFPDVEIKPKSFSSKKYKFLPKSPSIIERKVKFDNVPPTEYNFKIDVTTSVNHLSNLTPEVRKIDLLDFEDLVSSAKKVKSQTITLDKFKKTKIEKLGLPVISEPKKVYKIKIPSIGSFKFSEQKIPLSTFTNPTVSEHKITHLSKVKTWYANFKFPDREISLYFRRNPDKTKSADKGVPQYLIDQLGMILANIRKVDWEKYGRKLTRLEKFEEDSAKFLVESDYALLQDEFGIDVQKETIAALKVLFTNRVIKSALIITDRTVIGNPNFAKHLNIQIGWTDKIKKICPELVLQIIQGNNDERADLWNKSKQIVVADIETSLSDYRLKILEDKSLSKFDCIILDSVENILADNDSRTEFLSALQPKILWVTSSVLDNRIKNELNNLLNPGVQIEKSQIRSKVSLSDTLPEFLLNEYWCDADENQLAEFKTSLNECKKDLRRVLESGNPLRFYANIFTLFHKLNQIGNFASTKARSPKTDLLMRHLSLIKNNGKKALLLSQYEKLGTKKITELCNENGIKHILAPNSLSAEDMQKAVSTFHAQNDIVVFITDAKINKLKFSDFNIQYLIKFDQWWNPISNWELEDIFLNDASKDSGDSINICNYYSSGTLDQRIRELLIETDLINKNIFELMPAKMYEELIQVEEWLRVFGMPVSDEEKSEQSPEKVQTVLKKIPIDEFRKILTRLFTILGFSHVDVLELPNSNSFNLIGKSQRNGREFFLNAHVFAEPKVDKKAVENILRESSSSTKDKIFIIMREEFPVIAHDKLKENVSLMDGLSLSKLLIRAGILPTQP